MTIRDTVEELLEGKVENRTHAVHHINHCYDALRQAIICRADDTPLYVPLDTFFAGDGQQRRCRNWNTLQEWVIQHTACYDPVRCGG
jgi:Mycotoxin biosynthesis protein UstYa